MTSSRLFLSFFTNGPDFELVVSFECEIDGTTYNAEQGWLVAHGPLDRGKAETAEAAHAPETAVAVYVNPANPAQAVIVFDARSSTRIGLITLSVIGVVGGITMVVAGAGFLR